jgi:predicted RNA methylase
VKTLSPAACDVLTDDIAVTGNALRITRQLTDRKLYLEVNAALEAIGGKWDRKAKAHLFPNDPLDAIDQVASDGRFTDKKRDLDQFFTPPALAKAVVARAAVAGCSVLEPSAGHGALAWECVAQDARSVTVVEKDPACMEHLAGLGPRTTKLCSLSLRSDDFLDLTTSIRFDRVVANPPFSRQQDIAHVTKAFDLLVPGGRLVAIMSAGVTFRNDKKTTAFRALVDLAHGTIESLPDKAFHDSGTDVRTVVVQMTRS